MNIEKTLESQMLSSLHERQLKTLEQGINDIEQCDKEFRLYIIFVYENEIIKGIVTDMDLHGLTIKNKIYKYDKITNLYSYFTVQKIPLEKLKEWFDEEE
jgi:hypothetical protein